jgi:putative hydrolase of the HAD superfamily
MDIRSTEECWSYLLFDLGGVLIDLHRDQILQELAASLPPAVDMHELWAGFPPLRQFETGVSSLSEFAVAVCEFFKLDISEELFRRRFADFVGRAKPGATELLTAQRSRFRIGCLSNTNYIHMEKVMTADKELMLLFDDLFLSYEVGLMKPDQAVYEYVLQKIQVPPEQVAFFDDSRTNVEAAAALGMAAFLVESPAVIADILRDGGWSV